jgi:hypothetical protein
LIIVLGLCEQERIVGNFCGTGIARRQDHSAQDLL